ncbi:MAG TPA: hypothetical protein VFT64_04000 [Rickettsiales bacterium]|nr:hypothetical protein [Rickettsiales bacterium]
MTIYSFRNDSLIDEVAVTHTRGGGVRAYLHARDDAPPQKLEMLQEALTGAAMRWTPITHNGKAALEVRHIGKNGQKLLSLLEREGVTSGQPERKVNPENQISFKDKLRSNTLRLSGLSYTAGDIGFVVYGYKDSITKGPDGKTRIKDPQNLLAGIFYALGSPIITFFGKGDKSDIQLRHMSYNTMKLLEQKGFNVPHDAALRSITDQHNSTIGRRILSMCKRYPAEIGNSLFGVAGSMVLWAGIRDYGKIKAGTSAKSPVTAISDMSLGVVTMLAGAASLIPEEVPKPGEPKKTGIAGAWEWVKEKPLRTAGLLLGLSTIGHTTSTLVEQRNSARQVANGASESLKADAQKNIGALLGRWGFVVTNLLAEVLMSLSSKGHGEGVESDTSLHPSLYSAMGDLIQRSPPEKRASMLETIASYLSDKDNLNLDEDTIKEGIQRHMKDLTNNPWLIKPAEPQQNAQQADAAPRKAWRDVVTQQAQAAPAMSGSPAL